MVNDFNLCSIVGCYWSRVIPFRAYENIPSVQLFIWVELNISQVEIKLTFASFTYAASHLQPDYQPLI